VLVRVAHSIVDNSRCGLAAVDGCRRDLALRFQPGRMTNDDSTAPSPSRAPITAGTPEAMLALIPHLLGFYPSQSLVVVGLSGKRHRVRVTFRYDLPDPADPEICADIAEHAAAVLRREHIGTAALVGYGPAATAVPALVAAADWLTAHRIRLAEVLRADGGRFWSLLCADPACCGENGRPFDPGKHPVAAAMAAAGQPALPDRAALASTLQPPAGSTAVIRNATRAAEQRLCELGSQHLERRGEDPCQVTDRVGRKAIGSAIRHYRDGGAIASPDEIAWLAVLLADLRVRDDAWARMIPAHKTAHLRLWTDVVRGAATEYVPAPAALLAFTAWQSGNGALACVAVDRALTARPGYSMALLLEEALQAGLPPSAARLPMTPTQVAASYAAREEEADESARPAPGQCDRARSGAGEASGPAETTSGASSRPSA
jgi:Domain of unknown function (DUF4192)